jgi:hypothetical protein
MVEYKRAKRIMVASTKITPKDDYYLQLMVDRYANNGQLKHASVSSLLRIIVKKFLQQECPEYHQLKSITNHTHQLRDANCYYHPSMNLDSSNYVNSNV